MWVCVCACVCACVCTFASKRIWDFLYWMCNAWTISDMRVKNVRFVIIFNHLQVKPKKAQTLMKINSLFISTKCKLSCLISIYAQIMALYYWNNNVPCDFRHDSIIVRFRMYHICTYQLNMQTNQTESNQTIN